MSDYNFDLRPLFWLVAFIVLAIWGAWEIIDWLWIDNIIESSEPINPELQIIVKDNVVDTVYIYREP